MAGREKSQVRIRTYTERNLGVAESELAELFDQGYQLLEQSAITIGPSTSVIYTLHKPAAIDLTEDEELIEALTDAVADRLAQQPLDDLHENTSPQQDPAADPPPGEEPSEPHSTPESLRLIKGRRPKTN